MENIYRRQLIIELGLWPDQYEAIENFIDGGLTFNSASELNQHYTGIRKPLLANQNDYNSEAVSRVSKRIDEAYFLYFDRLIEA